MGSVLEQIAPITCLSRPTSWSPNDGMVNTTIFKVQ